MTKPFLLLQLRPEDDGARNEYDAILDKSGLREDQVRRIRLDQEPLPPTLSLDAYAAVIVGGGPGCVSDDPATKNPTEARIEAQILSLMPDIVQRDMPFLGCCYGIGILAHHLGTEVSKKQYGEPVGPVLCEMTPEGAQDPLLQGLPQEFHALVGHKEAVQSLPQGASHLISSGPCPFQMIRYGRNVYATQFHPEGDGPVFADRIKVYNNHGYFSPAEAQAVTDRCLSEEIVVPPEILRRFVARYR